MPIQRTQIDPASRGTRIEFNARPGTLEAGQLDVSSILNDAGVGGGHTASAQQVGTEFGFDQSRDIVPEIFQSQLGAMNVDFRDQADQLADRTAGLGRTGSGMFSREAGQLTDRARATREALLGNMAMQATQADLGRDVQAAQLGSAAEQANQQAALQASMQNARLGLQGDMFDASNTLDAHRFNLANQMAADQFNIQNQWGADQFGLQHMVGQQQREDRMAREAQQDQLSRLGLLQQGFGGRPDSTMMGIGQGLFQGSGIFGNAARGAGQAMQQFGQGLVAPHQPQSAPPQHALPPAPQNIPSPDAPILDMPVMEPI